MTRAAKRSLHRDTSGSAYLEYMIILVFVTLPFYLALVPTAAAIFHNYTTSRDTVLRSMP